jgi:hypothetical protein
LYAATQENPGYPGNTVVRLAMPALTTDLIIPQSASDLAVAPGHPNTVAIAPAIGGSLVIFDNAVARPQTGPLISHLQRTADASSIIATDSADLYTLGIDATGVASTHAVMEYIAENRAHFDNGLAYIDDGRIVDPVTGSVVFQLQNTFAVLPDSAHGKIFAHVGPGNAFSIASFDINTYQQIASVPIPTYLNWPRRMIKWGNNGVAVTSDYGYVVVISGDFAGP